MNGAVELDFGRCRPQIQRLNFGRYRSKDQNLLIFFSARKFPAGQPPTKPRRGDAIIATTRERANRPLGQDLRVSAWGKRNPYQNGRRRRPIIPRATTSNPPINSPIPRHLPSRLYRMIISPIGDFSAHFIRPLRGRVIPDWYPPHLARRRKSCPAGDLLVGLVVGL